MNNNAICFICCYNDENKYNEMLKYINSLYVPNGFQVENISIKESPSMTEGYNAGMNATKAKYKVYLHQDVFIINKNFIYDILKLFNDYPKVGLIGATGAKTIPSNGVWWESILRFGNIYGNHTGKMKLLKFNDVDKDYESVKVIDGLIMITQYDVLWREDKFNGWHFYDVSQSLEFIKKGYEVAILNNKEPWYVHDSGTLDFNEEELKNQYEKYRNTFIDEYHDMLD